MRQRLFVLSLTIWIQLFAFQLFAQDMTVYDEHKNSELIFKFSPYEHDESLPNYFISQMAHAQSRLRSYYKYGISANIHSLLIKQKPNHYHIIIHIDSIIKTGNFNFRGFNFSRLIFPHKLYFQYQVKELNSGNTYKYKKSIRWKNLSSFIIDTTFTDSTNRGAYTLTDEKWVYTFTKQQKNAFNTALNNIELYYKEGKKLSDIQTKINLLQPNNIDNITLQNIDLKYLIKDYRKLLMPTYATTLSLQLSDPGGYYHQYKTIGRQLALLKTTFDTKRAQLDSLYFTKGIVMLKDSSITKAKEYFNKSLKYNSNYTPSLYSLSRIYYQNRQYGKAEYYLNELLKLDSTTTKYTQFANELYQVLLQKGKALNEVENYNEGLKILLEAKAFCKRNSTVIQCDSNQLSKINQAKHGMYASFLSIAGAALQRGRLDMTEDYLNIADNYQKAHNDAITNSKEVDALYTLLATQYLGLSIEKNKNLEFQLSKRYWQYADSLSKAHKLKDAQSFVQEVKHQLTSTNYQGSIAKQKAVGFQSKVAITPIKTGVCHSTTEQSMKKSYQLHFDQGTIYYTYHRYRKAYPELKLAQEIAQRYSIPQDDSLDSYLAKSAKVIILNNLSKARTYAWGHKYAAAKRMLITALKNIKTDKLSNDSTIQQAIARIKISLQQQQNDALSKEYSKSLLKARQSIDFKDYISTEKYCRQAIKITKEHQYLPLDSIYPMSLLNKYKQAALYQKKLQEASKLITEAKIPEALNLFSDAQKLFYSKKLSHFGLASESLYHFVTSHNSKVMSDEAIKFAIKTNDINTAVDLWKEAIGHHWIIPKNDAVLCMQLLANADKRQYPDADKKKLYNQRFGNNTSFKKYRKYYYKAF